MSDSAANDSAANDRAANDRAANAVSTETADEKAAVLAEAVACAGRVPGVGDVSKCLQTYYRHVAEDDLIAAGPVRLAAVTRRHVEFAVNRPQGRALVQVRRGGEATVQPGSDVIDIVTDDMPFLVDSITMELANHDLAARLVVHPQLLVRRDLTGDLRDIVGQVGADQAKRGEPSHEELAESWTHIEIPPLAEGEAEGIEADLLRVLSDVRVAVEDYVRMRTKAISLADSVLSREGGDGGGVDSAAEIAELLRWLADGHFTFLGYREYDLEIRPDGMALTAVPGSGLGILRHDRVGPGSFATLPDEVKARALDPQRLIMTKANSRSTVHRPSYLDYVAFKRLSPAGEVVGEYRFLGLYTHTAFAKASRPSRSCGASWPRCLSFPE